MSEYIHKRQIAKNKYPNKYFWPIYSNIGHTLDHNDHNDQDNHNDHDDHDDHNDQNDHNGHDDHEKG